jgi:DNA-binding CsgD family transcriptional regulator
MLPADRLRAAFGFTEAEARLAALMAAGEDLRSAAEALEITYGTARMRLAQIFDKTETRRQGELIKLLLTTML